MLYLAALALKGDGPTPLIHFGFALLTLAGLFAFSARYFSAQVRWRAVAILCAVPSFILVATWPYNDIALAFYSFAAFYAVTVAKERGEVRWFALTGVFAGFALGEKYTAVAVPIALFVLIARPNRAALKNAMVMAVVAALVAAPWSIRNVVFTGNPVYPFIFGGPYWDAYRAAHFTPPSEMLVQPWRLVIAPWEATILGVQGTTSFDTTIGPLLLMLLPLLALVWKRGERVVNDALIFSGVLYLFWLVGIALSEATIQTRLLFSAFPTLALLAALAWERLPALDHPRFSLARFATLVVALVFALTLLAQMLELVALNPFSYLAGYESRAEFLNKRLIPRGYFDAMQFVTKLPAGSKVLFLWEPRDYYASGAAVTQSDPILDTFGHLRYLCHDADGIARALKERGFTHLLINRWGLDYQLMNKRGDVSVEDVHILRDLTARHARQVYGTLPLDFADQAEENGIAGIDAKSYAIYALSR
jgi:hypothetical protein